MTRHEQRCSKFNDNLFSITNEMPEELKLSRLGVFEKNIINDEDILHNETDSIERKKYNFRKYDQDQSFFIPVTKERFLHENHPAIVIDKIVEKLDLTVLYARYSKEGNPPYHPKLQLKVLFYAYYDGVMSSRSIWDSVVHRSDFIYLAAGQVPDFRTINRFRASHLDILSVFFTQIVLLCKELDMLDFQHLAIDGEKIQANASYKNSKNLKGVKKEYEKIKEGIKKLLEKEVNEYFTEEKKIKRVNRLENKLEKLDNYKKVLESFEDEDKRINIVDEAANVMTHKDGQKLPSYTHQSARDGKCGVVTAAQTRQSNDNPENLIEITDKSIENSGEKHKEITADCGFSSYDMLEKIEDRDENFYVPDRRFKSSKKNGEKKAYSQEEFTRGKNGVFYCPDGKIMKHKQIIKSKDGRSEIITYEGTNCKNCAKKDRCTSGKKRTINIDSRIELRDKMRDKLKSDKGREIYMKRQGIIEPVHGDDQKNKKWIQHHLRGLKKASGEFILMRIATNLGCIVKHRTKMILENY